MKPFFLTLTASVAFHAAISQNQLSIASNFPGGNVTVDSVRGNHIYFQPDLRDTWQEWFYWYFSVKTTKTDTVHFHLNKINCLTNRGPAVSTDQGRTWKWTTEKYDENSFSVFVPAGKEVRVSMGMPYTQANLDRFLKPYLKHKSLTVSSLCDTPKGRKTEKLIIGPKDEKSVKQKVLITARHHSCEMMVNYSLEGFIAALLSNQPEMVKLRETTQLWIIPFMDKDGVEDGDQGKSRKPRDHNRDYDGESIYCSTRSLRNSVPAWTKGSTLIALDLHCPWIKGNLNEHIYLVGNAEERISREQQAFMQVLATHNKGSVSFDPAKGFVPFGTAWNTAKNYTQGKSFASWASGLEETKLATTFEIPYSLNSGQELTPENLREFGKDMAYSLVSYMTK